jgi:NAD(P)-dependent dehydrogenase (short-subunit alcohol dehydrogenase family)
MNEIFSIKDKVTVITGAGGVLGGSIAKSFVKAGAKVVAIDIREESLNMLVDSLNNISTDGAIGIVSNVLNMEDLTLSAQKVIDKWGRVDVLLNIAGGNMPGATLRPDQSFFEMKIEDWEKVIDLNMNGTIYPCYVFGNIMATQKTGCIVNISSMAAYSAITRVPGYSAAKSAVSNFTKWLASEMALKYGDNIRVNAIAPGFFIGDQNRRVLIDDNGKLTKRSQKILAKTPMNRFGDISELNGVVQFLCSDAAKFITGTIIPVDGGFNAFSGV